MQLISKQILAIGLPVVAVAASGVAIAYWTTNGTGSGTAATSAGESTLRVDQTAAPSDMAPGVAPGDITVTVTNTGAAGVPVSKVVVSIASVTKAGAPVSGCSAADYTLANATMTDGATASLAPNAVVPFSGASLGFANSTLNDQDACKGATVNLSYAAS